MWSPYLSVWKLVNGWLLFCTLIVSLHQVWSYITVISTCHTTNCIYQCGTYITRISYLLFLLLCWQESALFPYKASFWVGWFLAVQIPSLMWDRLPWSAFSWRWGLPAVYQVKEVATCKPSSLCACLLNKTALFSSVSLCSHNRKLFPVHVEFSSYISVPQVVIDWYVCCLVQLLFMILSV